jgi:gliding motility-associated-like protein
LHDNAVIANNSSTNFSVTITGGTSPYSFTYTRNGASQSAINNYNSGTIITTGVLTTGTYTYALASLTDAFGCEGSNFGTNITITVSENANLTPGAIGNSQSVCYNSVPAPLTQLTAPAGGTGSFTYQWKSSPDNSAWTDIAGATQQDYSPPALTATIYYLRTVTSGSYIPVNSSPVQITVYPEVELAQLHDNIYIEDNTSTNFTISISGGVSPFTVEYTRNGIAQPVIDSYSGEAEISTGILTAGAYTYELVSVTDDNGCQAQSLGDEITITATGLISGVPNVFTPNGDGINETWEIPSIQNFPGAVIRIYDRTLKEVIEYKGADPEWDGRDSNGTPLPSGSYLYIIDLHNNTRPLKGYVSLVK